MATIRDVAKYAGVSPTTVSRAVNGLVGYSEETRHRVEEWVARLNYETDFKARGLKTRQTSVIGLLAPGVGLIMVLIFQRRLVEGLTSGGTK